MSSALEEHHQQMQSLLAQKQVLEEVHEQVIQCAVF